MPRNRGPAAGATPKEPKRPQPGFGLVRVTIGEGCLEGALVVGLAGLVKPPPPAVASTPLFDRFGRLLGPDEAGRRARWKPPSDEFPGTFDKYFPSYNRAMIGRDPEKLSALRIFAESGSQKPYVARNLAKETTDPEVHDRAVYVLRKIGTLEAYDALNQLAGSNIPGLAAKARAALELGPLP